MPILEEVWKGGERERWRGRDVEATNACMPAYVRVHTEKQQEALDDYQYLLDNFDDNPETVANTYLFLLVSPPYFVHPFFSFSLFFCNLISLHSTKTDTTIGQC